MSNMLQNHEYCVSTGIITVYQNGEERIFIKVEASSTRMNNIREFQSLVEEDKRVSWSDQNYPVNTRLDPKNMGFETINISNGYEVKHKKCKIFLAPQNTLVLKCFLARSDDTSVVKEFYIFIHKGVIHNGKTICEPYILLYVPGEGFKDFQRGRVNKISCLTIIETVFWVRK